MKFQLAINMERVPPGIGMRDVARGLRCPAPPRHALLTENLWPKDWGKPSRWVTISETWY